MFSVQWALTLTLKTFIFLYTLNCSYYFETNMWNAQRTVHIYYMFEMANSTKRYIFMKHISKGKTIFGTQSIYKITQNWYKNQ